MKTGWVGALVVVVVAMSSAQTLAGETRQVGVICLERAVPECELLQDISALLADQGIDVIGPGSLRARLALHQVGPPSGQVVQSFVGLGAAIAQGIERFFYKGEAEAIAQLLPLFTLGIDNLDVLARRQDYADQIFQAGVVLVRAYRAQAQHEQAEAIAQNLARHFPGKLASASLVPPDIIALLADQAAHVAAAQTRLTLVADAAEGCQRLVNGVAAGALAIHVHPDTPYFITLDCGSNQAPLWRISVAGGESIQAPLTGGDPMEVVFATGDPGERAGIASALGALVFWSGLDTLVGVGARQSEPGAAIFRVERSAGARWSETHAQESTRQTLARLFPELSFAEPVALTQGPASAPRSVWLTPALFGTGAAVGIAGGAILYLAQGQAVELRCSPDALSLSDGDCAGVREVRFQNQAQFDDARASIRTQRIIGSVGLGAGVGLLGWGLWRALSPGDNDAAQMALWLAPNGAGAGVAWRY
ncbi:MAG: hypothetical protein H0U74_07815 [Bradymonadaceae bacterium]|nr:hypothetical protein [Lujinxingiaceae bacterium]